MESLSQRKAFKGLIALSIFSYLASVWAFISLEKKSPLEAIYFVVVTLSTVGFGDITPQHPVTKIIVIILITVGISTLAYLTQGLAERIADRSREDFLLPSKLPELESHVLIFGVTPVSKYIAAFLKDRFFRVIILGFSEDDIIVLRRKGFESYLLLDIIPEDLKILKVESAKVIYTFIHDENETIQIVLNIRELANDPLIFSKTGHNIGIDLGQLLGINRTYHNERLIGSFINFLSQKSELTYIPNQEVPTSLFYILLTGNEQRISNHCDRFYTLANVGENLNDVGFEVITESEQKLYAVYQEEINLERCLDRTNKRDSYRKLFIGGFSEEIHHIIEHITIENREIDILVFNEEEFKLAVAHGYPSIQLKMDSLIDIIEEEISDQDLVVNMFDTTTESLNLTLSIRKSKVYPRIFQYARSYVENEIFKKVKVDRIFSPRSLSARAMILIFLKEINESPSYISENNQIFEHYVKDGDPIIGKSVKEIRDENYRILLYAIGKNVIENVSDQKIISQGDTLILHTKIDI